MVKKCVMRRFLALAAALSILLSVLPTVFSEEAPTEETAYAADRLFRQIDDLCGTVKKRGASAGEAAFAALSDNVYALVEASGTAKANTLEANGEFIHWVDIETGVPCCYSPDHEAVKAGMTTLPEPSGDMEDVKAALRSAEPARTVSNSDCPQSLNVGLLQPYWESSEHYGDENFLRYSQFFLQQSNLLVEKMGGELIHFSMGNVNADTIAFTIQNCGIVIINSHGSTDYKNENDKTSRANSSYLWLNPDTEGIVNMRVLLNPEDYTTAHTGPFGTYYDAYYSGGKYCINGTVISNHMTADAPNSFVYFGCCLGMATDGLAAPIREKGVETVLGFSQSVTFRGDYSYMMSFTDSLADGDTVAEALAIAKQEVGIIDPYKVKNPCYPIVVSSTDPYPGQGNVDAPQTVNSSWHLSTRQVNYSVPSTAATIPTVYCGGQDSVTLPAAEDVEGYTFVGWSETPIGSETSVSGLLYENSVYEPLLNNTTLYAVYTRKESHTGGYVKVTTTPSVLNGNYLIVYEDGGAAFNAAATDIDSGMNYITVNIDNDQIASSTAVEAAAVTIRRVSGKSYYSIQLPNGKYIGNIGTGNGFNTTQSLSEAYASDIVFNSQDQTVSITNTAGNYALLFSDAVNSNRFSYYAVGKINTAQHPICLYRKDSIALIDIYTTSPNTACAHDAWSTVVTAATCLHGGYTTKTCTNCGTSWTTGNTAALGHWLDRGVVKPAADGSFGYTTYTCRRSGCGYSYQTDFNGLDYEVALQVQGATWQTLTVNSYNGAMLPDPVAAVDGYTFAGWSETPILSESATADLIEDLYYPMEDSTVYAIYSRNVDGVIFYSMTQSALKIYSASLILNGKIDVAFSAQLPAGYSDPRMVVNGKVITDYSLQNGNCVFLYTGINPQCIGDGLTATLYATCNGEEESVSVENYSVRQYCVNKLRDGTISNELRRLLSDLLAYGEAAQLYTDYKTDALITDGDDISDPMYSFIFYLTGYRVRIEDESDKTTRWINAGLTLTNSVAMTFRFYAEDLSGLTVAVNLNGRTRTYTEFTAVNGEADTYEITLDEICATEFDDEVSASFARNGKRINNTLFYSVNAYVQSAFNSENSNLAYLVAALYNYGVSAQAYVNAQANE
ncbi:MAG: InlB B-repeat-containing protein [Oscillospiraceae bacterium]|nr:InlB B-repeat-containing protein [Oscillospiraceae bacterium]